METQIQDRQQQDGSGCAAAIAAGTGQARSKFNVKLNGYKIKLLEDALDRQREGGILHTAELRNERAGAGLALYKVLVPVLP